MFLLYFSPLKWFLSWFKYFVLPLDKSLLFLIGNVMAGRLWPLLLTWFNFNPSMDK